jgi:uridine kinase
VNSSDADFENRRLVIVDGLMLYNIEELHMRPHAKLLIRLNHEDAKWISRWNRI